MLRVEAAEVHCGAPKSGGALSALQLSSEGSDLLGLLPQLASPHGLGLGLGLGLLGSGFMGAADGLRGPPLGLCLLSQPPDLLQPGVDFGLLGGKLALPGVLDLL